MPEKKTDKKMIFEMAYASSLGIGLVFAIFGCLFLGAYIDKKLGTTGIFTILFLIIGVVAGFRNYYVFIKRYLAEDKKAEKESNDESDKKIRPAKKN